MFGPFLELISVNLLLEESVSLINNPFLGRRSCPLWLNVNPTKKTRNLRDGTRKQKTSYINGWREISKPPLELILELNTETNFNFVITTPFQNINFFLQKWLIVYRLKIVSDNECNIWLITLDGALEQISNSKTIG